MEHILVIQRNQAVLVRDTPRDEPPHRMMGKKPDKKIECGIIAFK